MTLKAQMMLTGMPQVSLLLFYPMEARLYWTDLTGCIIMTWFLKYLGEYPISISGEHDISQAYIIEFLSLIG